MRQKVRNSLIVFLLISFLFHLGVWTGLKLAPTPQFLIKNDKVEIEILDQSPTQKQKELRQIVEQEKTPLNDEKPEEAKYLSAHNQRVVKETRALNSGDFRNSAARQNSEGNKATGGRHHTPLSSLSPAFDPAAPPRQIEEDVPNKGGARQLASQSNDYLKNIQPSLETLLSTREFVYYTYYQRIRGQIRQFWEPSIREKVKKIFAEGRSIASEKDHITRIVITLNKQGGLIRVQVVGESGIKDLDDAAIEAFRAAEPFPNPPKGIVEKDGTIKINWDFILEAGLNSILKQQRYARNAWPN